MTHREPGEHPPRPSNEPIPDSPRQASPEESASELREEEQSLNQEFERLAARTVAEADQGITEESDNDRRVNQVHEKIRRVRRKINDLSHEDAEPRETGPPFPPTDTIPSVPINIGEHLSPRPTTPAPTADTGELTASDRAHHQARAAARISKAEATGSEDAARATAESDPSLKQGTSGNIRLPDNPPPDLSDLEKIDLGAESDPTEVESQDLGDELPSSDSADRMAAEVETLRREIADMERNITATKEMISRGLDPNETFLREREEKLAAKKAELSDLEKEKESAGETTEANRAERENFLAKEAERIREIADADPNQAIKKLAQLKKIAAQWGLRITGHGQTGE